MKSVAIKKTVWSAFFCLSLGAVFYYRADGERADEVGSWIPGQSEEIKLAKPKSAPKYLCVGGKAFELGEGGEIELTEDLLILDGADAQRKCDLPHFPKLEKAKALFISTSPSSGYGASLLSFNKTDSEAIKTLNDGLALSGWNEIGISKTSNSLGPLRARMFEREGAWLFFAMASKDSDIKNSLVLLAGRFDPVPMR